ncbi:serine protease inhibitor, serpin [Culex quinquefasciatus]|uniref:Serine protease inhibitor, serpin n=1 Tax=Culex quinquefasciatus TaxID=7176 RepID=B0XAK6_CULQU|nr:serine protease inhibitor, serpin [Culex quinquefasciatus]|eukprot:XP_001866678.1 serine protease inhibitor, serpin [Culex quinquefasciatus]
MLVLLYEATGVGEISGANPPSTELRLVLEPNGDLQDTRTNYQQLLESVLKSDSMYDVRLDTKFFLDDFIDVASKYELIVEHFYNASAENVPFSKPREAVEVINDWASSVTQGRINKLVSEADITNSVIALASIASFKGQWKSPFPASNTRQGIFNGVQVDYIQQIDLLYYDDSTTLGAQLLRMPYQGGKFAMFFMLPHKGQTVDDVLGRITPQVLHQALWYMDELDVNVTIPKFKFDFSVQLSESLQKQVFAEKSNAVISPFLVKLMLVLLYEATGVGEISGANPLSTELRLVLEPNGDLQDTRTNYQQLLESVLKSDSMYDVRLDTKFFLDDFIDVASKYELIVEHFYNASAENVPFSKPREAVEVINDWANSVTQGRINKLVSEADITNSVIALASIASFKGQWKSPFPASNTRQGIFNGVQVDYMQQIDLLYYDDSTTLGAQLLRMPYQGGKFAMFFMLPHQNQTVDDVLQKVGITVEETGSDASVAGGRHS